ncbi:PAS domain S-box protein [Oculatella sp. FACHB-28]|uniref:PAS domain S-box protein n=1 Tax=Oculatella sp. FACHB-28 TaxID=2692845 RepID=UPI0018EFBF1C|nr:PAS domain S-box protein [Oculatella sp. FACHB-28]
MTEGNLEQLWGKQARLRVLPTQLVQYGVALLSVAFALGTTLSLSSYLEPTPTALFFAAVMVSAWYGGLGPGIFATILSTLAINYFLLESINSLNTPDLGTVVRLGVFVMAALLINSLNESQRAARRRAEANLQSLRESEARFGCLAESNIIGTIVAELNGAILDANDNFLQLVGYTEEELRSGRMHWREMTSPESLEMSERAVQELLTTGACTPFEKEYLRKDGSRIPVLHGAVMTGEATVTGFVLDLSERKRSEAIQQEALRRERSLHAEVQAAKAQLETVLASLNDQFLVLDQDWRYIYVSDRVVKTVGKSREELIGKCIWDLFPDTVGSQFYTEVHRAVAEQQTGQFEYFYTPWQRWFENRVYPSNTGISILVTDITQRKQAEAELQASEERFRLLLATTTAVVWTTNAEGEFICTQPSRENYTGQCWEEYAGWGWLEMFHPDDREALNARWSRALAERSYYEAEGRLWHAPSQQYRHIITRAVPLLNTDGSVREWVGMDTDIHDQKLAEEALRQSEARFQVLVSNMPGMVYRYASGKDGETVFTYVSSGSCELVELEPETILQDANSFLALIHPDDLTAFQESVAIAIENSAVWQWEGRLITPSGQFKWIQGRSRPQQTEYGEAWDGLLFDITERVRVEDERKQAEAALRQSEERLRVALKNSPITVFNQDQDLRYTWIYNPAFGHRIPEVIGKQDQDLLPEDDAAILTHLKRRVLETGSSVREEVKLTMQEQDFYYDLTVEPLKAENGETVGITCASIDITERKQMELELRQSETTLNALIASSPIGVAFFDRDLRYIHANEALAVTNGIPLSEHLGRTLGEVLPKWAPVIAPILRQVMETQEPLLNQEVVGVTYPSDLMRYALVNYFPVCLANGQVLGVGVTSVDISDRKRVEDERKQIQQELQQTLQTLQTVVAASPLPIVVIEPDMTVKLWNSAAEQLFGWSEAEVLGELLPLVPEEKQEECRQLRDTVTNGEVSFAVETYRCKRDGSHVILSISAAPLYDDHNSVSGILLILQDITERQRAEAALRDSEERLRLALIAANQGLYDLNVQTGDAIVSPAYAEMLGYDPNEFQETNAKWRDRLHPDDVSVVYQAYEDYISGKLDTYQVEFRQRTQSGDWKWILSIGKTVAWDSDGQPLRMLGTHTDITDRKRAEESLRQSEERLRLALDAGCMGAWEWNLETNVQRWDVNQYKLFGMDKDSNQLSTDTFFQFIHPDDLPSAQQLTEQVLEQGGSFHTEFRIITLDGSIRWLSSQGIVVQDSHNRSIRMIGINFDITERKQEEAERERLLANEQLARQEAERANRIKDEFLAVLSHELRSPLNPILGWSRLLQTQKLDEQKTRQALSTIERNAKLQTQLIEDLLDVSRILRGKLVLNTTPVSLINTIEAALETVRLAIEAKGIQVQRAFNLNIDQVMGDAARLQQVVWNLLTNAVKFTPSGGTIEIRLEQSNTQAQIQVKDTGKGIKPEFLPYVFDYFRQEDGTTTRKFGGLGLGLAIVRHITELHGGRVWVESPGEGLGATFTVQLPLISISMDVVDEQAESPTIANLSGLRVLAVDDDTDIRELIAFILQQAGAEVCVVASATEALQQLEVFSPEILISDVGMPDFDGYMLMRQIRRLPLKRGIIPAIALTAYAGEIDQQQAIASGFQMHLAKPVEPEKLIGAIVTLLNDNAG